jgi:hypothetical protein
VRAEGNDATARIARRARGELVELAVQRPAGPQQLDHVVMGPHRHQLQRAGLGREAREVLRDAGRERAGARLVEHDALGARAGCELQREGAEELQVRGSVVHLSSWLVDWPLGGAGLHSGALCPRAHARGP